MDTTKQTIREEMRRQAAAFLADGRAERESARILAALEDLPAFRDASCVLIYMALPDEVRTAPLLERWAGRKRFAIPRVHGLDLELCEYDPAHLQAGYKGILEPTPDAVLLEPEDIDLAVIPGVAFASERNAYGQMIEGRPPQTPLVASLRTDCVRGNIQRLGRGKGFYDRLLPQLHCPTVGICYPFRVLPDIPTDPWDRPLDGLIY